MSPDNLDILRAAYEAEPDGEDVLQYLDPAVELYPGIETPDQDTRYVGTASRGAIGPASTGSHDGDDRGGFPTFPL